MLYFGGLTCSKIITIVKKAACISFHIVALFCDKTKIYSLVASPGSNTCD